MAFFGCLGGFLGGVLCLVVAEIKWEKMFF